MCEARSAKIEEPVAIVADLQEMAEAQIIAQKLIWKLRSFQDIREIKLVLSELDSDRISSIYQIEWILRASLKKINKTDNSSPIKIIMEKCIEETEAGSIYP